MIEILMGMMTQRKKEIPFRDSRSSIMDNHLFTEAYTIATHSHANLMETNREQKRLITQKSNKTMK